MRSRIVDERRIVVLTHADPPKYGPKIDLRTSRAGLSKKMMTHVRYRQVAFLAPHARFGLDFPCFWCRHRFVIEVTGKKIEKSFVKWVDLERRLRHDDASQQF